VIPGTVRAFNVCDPPNPAAPGRVIAAASRAPGISARVADRSLVHSEFASKSAGVCRQIGCLAASVRPVAFFLKRNERDEA